MTKCPNCDRRSEGTDVYQCSNCGQYGCMKGMMMGFLGPYSGCWSKKPCPNCGRSGTKKYSGKVAK